MRPRLRRLLLDYERIQRRFDGWPLIRLVEATGDPPESYVIDYLIGGLELREGGAVEERRQHRVTIHLSLGYPRRMPQCNILTPIFHPNFDKTTICIGDFWAASEGLDDLVVRIARMIAYQEYNIKSPLNGLAAKWAAENQALLPVDPREMAPPSVDAAEPVDGEELQISGGDLPGSAGELAEPAPAEPVAAIPSPPETGRGRTSSAQAPVQKQSIEDWVSLAPELRLLHLRVRCERCRHEFDLELTALRAPVVCPQCAFAHEGGRTYRCLTLESAGLFWFQEDTT